MQLNKTTKTYAETRKKLLHNHIIYAYAHHIKYMLK